jgi:hypothetical protein
LAQTFSCPNCGAMLEYGGSGRDMKCPYCGTTVQIPESVWQPVEQARNGNRWMTYILIFLFITVVLPTCLSLLGAALGIGGGVLAAFAPFILRFFGR